MTSERIPTDRSSLPGYGARLASPEGIPAIMGRVARAQAQLGPDRVMDLNAGNPPLIEPVVDMWRDTARAVLDQDIVATALSRYSAISGHPELGRAYADLLAPTGFQPTGDVLDHILVSPGSLAAISAAVLTFVGPDPGPDGPKLLLPQSPDFEGYRALGLPAHAIVGVPCRVQVSGPHEFRYALDWDALERIDFATIGAVVLSRPCNPTGGICQAPDLARLAALAAPHRVPIIVDSAYAPPVPGLVYGDGPFDFVWADNIIHVFSLSKAGLAGERVGVSVGPRPWLQPLRMAHAHLWIMASKMGQAMAAHAIASGALPQLCQTALRPHYQAQAQHLRAALADALGPRIPYRVHHIDGGVFAWLWLPELPCTDLELFERAAAQGLFFTPGSLFFGPEPPTSPDHHQRCIRLSLTADPSLYPSAMQTLARILHS